tara:strand:- start:44 stop:226 length:183 start_codon:yes stop_codon:yes gene_type:complete
VSFFDWMNMNMIVDIAFLVFAVAVVWKFRKTQKEITNIRSDLDLAMKNPQAAKRLLKERR